MIGGGIIAILFGVDAEGKALEDIAKPLSVISRPPTTIFRSGADREGVDDIARAQSGSAGHGPVPGQRYGEYDDPAQTRPDDEPLA
jgi:hypothetical protein